ANDLLQVTATPDEGYEFDRWLVNGSDWGIANPSTFAASKDNFTIRAVFKKEGAVSPWQPVTATVSSGIPWPFTWFGDVVKWFGQAWENIVKSDQEAREKVATRSIAETRNIGLEQAATIRETTKDAYKPAGLGGWLWGGLSESMGELVKNSMNEALAEVVRLAPEATGHSPEQKQKLDAALEPYANSIVSAMLAEVDPAKFAKSPITPEEAKNSLNTIMGGVVGVEISLFIAHAFLEGATLGQIEALKEIETMVVSKLGLNQIASSAITIPLNELVLKRAQQYYAAEYTPEIPSYQDLIEMVVKEVIPLDEFKAQMKFLGYSEQWSQNIWDKHFIPPSLTDILTAWRRGLITEKRVDELMILVDLDPRFKDIFDTRKYVTPPLSLTRFMFETGAISAETVRANVALEGYAPEYVDGITSYIVNFQARRWRTRYLQALSTGMTKGVVTEAEVLKATLEAGYTEDVAKWIVETSKVRAKVTGAVEVGIPVKLLSVSDMKRLYLKDHITNDVLRTDMMIRGYSYDDTTLLITMLDEEKVVTAAGGSKVALTVAELVDAWKYEEITEDQLRTELQLRGLSLAEVEILIRTKIKKWGVGGQEAP
ncbi:hypothetical protein MUO93_06780, partial [Candidatus Bathyarchaeota archaeon]|nr:hypothetical protein [Candidatus Bathyarchaeota archaeon]